MSGVAKESIVASPQSVGDDPESGGLVNLVEGNGGSGGRSKDQKRVVEELKMLVLEIVFKKL